MTTQKTNIGIVGAGRIGRVHAENIVHRIPNARLVAVADIFDEVAGQLASDFQVPSVFNDYRRIMDDETIEAVLVCSSTETHSEIISAAAVAGKHVFCEKPIDHDLGNIDGVLAAVADAGVKLQVGFNRRFDPNFQRVREIVDAGDIGAPHIVRITSRDPEPPPIEYVKGSGGIFLDMTIHDFDMSRFLIDSEVDEVFATGGVMVDPRIGEAGDIDTAITTLVYANGVIGSIDNSRKAVYGYDQRVEVFGTEGVVVVSNNAPNTATISDVGGVHAAKPLYFFVERYTESYIEEMKAFLECVRNDNTPQVTGIDGRIPVVMGHAARKSYEENRPVRLSEVSALTYSTEDAGNRSKKKW